jgi:tyrosinase
MITRRRFIQSSLTAALVPLLPAMLPVSAQATSTLRTRPNWTTFRKSTLFQVYLNTVQKMRANTNSADPNSWNYWVNVHKNFCPHTVPYFLAWHRGFLYRIESQMRKISGSSGLSVPYWDYYQDPVMPAEFTDTTSPLYITNRKSTDVTNALTLAPFADTVVNFQRGLVGAFETSLETQPHNPVHNLIGGAMGSVTVSPRDPIFWSHHANVDRLWAAWVAAGNGRTMPPRTDAYWSGSFNYGPAVSKMARYWAMSTTGLGYQYEDETMPTALPAPTPYLAASALTVQGASSTLSNAISVSLGNGRPLSLDHRSLNLTVPLTDKDRVMVRSLLLRQAAADAPPLVNTSLRVVLDGVRLTPLGRQGGYFYKLFINLPVQKGVSQPESQYLIGTLGPFEITGMLNHEALMGGKVHGDNDPVSLSFPATDALQRLWPVQLDKLTISFVRVDAGAPVKGEVITVQSFRLEAADNTGM